MIALIKGIPVMLTVKTVSSYDDFGAPVYAETEVEVKNVLVTPVTNDGLVTSTDLTGKKTVYELSIPKGDSHEWRDTKVRFFGETFRTVGEPREYIEALVPLSWNKKIKVERYE